MVTKGVDSEGALAESQFVARFQHRRPMFHDVPQRGLVVVERRDVAPSQAVVTTCAEMTGGIPGAGTIGEGGVVVRR